MTFQELLAEHSVRFFEGSGHHHARQGWIQFDCPFCGADSCKFHMGYSITRRSINCYKCGPKRIVDTLIELTGLNFAKIKSLLGDLDHSRLPPEEKIKGKLELPRGVGPLLGVHRKYLEGRGFDIEELEKLWRIQGIGIASKLAWRIFIPFMFRARVVSWLTRSVRDVGMRYWSAEAGQEDIHHKDLLYGGDYVRHSTTVHEGPLDVWKVGPGATCTCGVGFSRAQVLKLSKIPRRAICFDNEPQAQRRARELCDALEPFPGETVNVCLDAKDAGSAKPKEIKKLRKLFLDQYTRS